MKTISFKVNNLTVSVTPHRHYGDVKVSVTAYAIMSSDSASETVAKIIATDDEKKVIDMINELFNSLI